MLVVCLPFLHPLLNILNKGGKLGRDMCDIALCGSARAVEDVPKDRLRDPWLAAEDVGVTRPLVCSLANRERTRRTAMRPL